MKSESIDQLATALVKAQAQVKGAVKDHKNPHLKSAYADLGSIADACKEALNGNGIAVFQSGTVIDGAPYLETMLLHVSGQFISGVIPLITGEPKGVSVMQALGSAITYARRYGLAAAGFVMTEDDDGHSAGTKPAKSKPAAKDYHEPANDSHTRQHSEPDGELINNNDVMELSDLLARLNVNPATAASWASNQRTTSISNLTVAEGRKCWAGYKKNEEKAKVGGAA